MQQQEGYIVVHTKVRFVPPKRRKGVINGSLKTRKLASEGARSLHISPNIFYVKLGTSGGATLSCGSGSKN